MTAVQKEGSGNCVQFLQMELSRSHLAMTWIESLLDPYQLEIGSVCIVVITSWPIFIIVLVCDLSNGHPLEYVAVTMAISQQSAKGKFTLLRNPSTPASLPEIFTTVLHRSFRTSTFYMSVLRETSRDEILLDIGSCWFSSLEFIPDTDLIIVISGESIRVFSGDTAGKHNYIFNQHRGNPFKALSFIR